MPIKEIFHFDTAAYRTRVHDFAKSGQSHELCKREILKRRRIFSCSVKIVCCSVLLLPTCGGTGIGLFLGIRQRHVAKQKYQHVVDAMRAHGIPLPKPKKSDKIVPLVINITIYTLSLGLLFGLEEAGITAANETAAYGMQGSANLIDPTHLGEVHQLAVDPSNFMQGLAHGVHTQAAELHGLITPGQTMVGHAMQLNLEQPLADTSASYLSGETAGAQLAPVLERAAAVQLATEGLERVAKVGTEWQYRRKPVGKGEKNVIVTETTLVKSAPVA